MKERIYNKDNLNIMDIDEIETRTKALMITSDNRILMGYYKKTYQFIGGHLREGESIQECLHREIKEETGIEYDTSKLKPFYTIKYYTKNDHDKGINTLSQVYYFIIDIDERYHMKDTNYDIAEIKGNYELRYVNLDDFNYVMIDSKSDEDELNTIILRDNIEVMTEYKRITNYEE